MSHFVAYILQFQEIIVYKFPPGGRGVYSQPKVYTSRCTAQSKDIRKAPCHVCLNDHLYGTVNIQDLVVQSNVSLTTSLSKSFVKCFRKYYDNIPICFVSKCNLHFTLL